MKVCVLGLRGIPGVLGGVETHCEQLYPRMTSHLSPDCSICVIGRNGYVPAGSGGFRGIAVEGIWSPRHHYFEAITHTLLGLMYARFVRGCDVVHLHAIGPGILAPLAKLLGLKVLFTHHGEDYRRAKWNGFARSVLRFGERMSVRFADRVIVVSPSLTRHLRESYPTRADAIVHIPNGAISDDGGLPPEAEGELLRRLGVEDGRFIMTAARLVPEKAVHELVRAHELSHSGNKLVIAGAAQSRSAYADELMAHASDRVVFAGQLTRAELAVLYRRTQLFVLASHHEGLPIAALEAMSAGARVLLSDIQANQDLQLPSQNYFPCGDIDALAKALDGIDQIPVTEPGKVRSRYNWDGIAKQTADVLNAWASDAPSRVAAR